MNPLARELPAASDTATTLLERFQRVRRASEALCAPLTVEDYVIQSMADVSPPKWHLAHVTWFFEAFILKPFLKGYQTPNPAYDYLFNSYYETHGKPFPRAARGHLSRPGVDDVYRFRAAVDTAMAELLSAPPAEHAAEIARRNRTVLEDCSVRGFEVTVRVGVETRLLPGGAATMRARSRAGPTSALEPG